MAAAMPREDAAVVAMRQRLEHAKRQKVKCKDQLVTHEIEAEVSEQQREVRTALDIQLALVGTLLPCVVPVLPGLHTCHAEYY
jgi:hypothetical protein